jgi:replicative DNA helicase
MSVDALAHVDAERTVLGCALLDTTALYRILPLLRSEDFSLDSHRRIYHVIAELAEAGKPVETLTVADALAVKGQLESVGGVAYLANLDDQVTSSLASLTNVEHRALETAADIQSSSPSDYRGIREAGYETWHRTERAARWGIE